MDLETLYSYLEVLKEQFGASTDTLRLFALRNSLPQDYCQVLSLCDNPTPSDRIAAIICAPDDCILDVIDILNPCSVFEKQLIFLTQMKIFFSTL